MKSQILLLAILLSLLASAQIKPASQVSFDSKWIKNEHFNMIFYSVNGTIKTEIGRIKNTIEITNKDNVMQSMVFSSKMFKTDFIDKSLYNLKTLKPILHESSNDQRTIRIKYEDSIRCSYKGMNDKKNLKHTEINKLNQNYFDSSTYQNIIRWLPLKNGYKKDLDLYNYDPNSTIGFMKAHITEVITEDYKTKKEGIRKVFKVTEFFDKSKTVHFIDLENRRLWKLEVNDGKVVIIREE